MFATAMGLAFIGGVLAVMIVRLRNGATGSAFNLVALVVAVSVPLTMSSDVSGVLQRLMFLTSAVWYAREASVARKCNESVQR